MELFYKGYKFNIQETDILGGIRIFHKNEKHIVARKGVWEGQAYTDLIAIKDELIELINSNNFKSIKQIPEYKFQ